VALKAHYAPALDRTEAFLGEVGRMKYLKPLYNVLASTPEYRGRARDIFQKHAERYHPIARQGVESILTRA
jgi:leukotriene-A4 hydrolase